MRSFPQIALLLLVALLILTIGSVRSAEPQDTSPKSLYQLELRDGTVLRGALADSSVRIHAPYGSLELPFKQIKRILFRQQANGWDAIETINRNRIIGIIHQEIRIQTAGEQLRRIHPSGLISLHQAAAPPSNTDSENSHFILLRNGDFLSGNLHGEKLSLSSPGSVKAINSADIESLRVERNPNEPGLLLLKDGSERSVLLENDALSFQLDLGPIISLSQWDIEVYYGRLGFVPQRVERHFAPATTTLIPEEQPEAPFPNYVWIPPGRYLMGSDSNEIGRGSDEGPQTLVRISRGFWMAQFEVTQAEYQSLMGSNPSTFTSNPRQPVEKVNWHEAFAYCQRLTEAAEEAGTLPRGYVFRLPTEAEWEYACRAGTDTRFSYGADPSDSELGRYAWYVENSDSSPHPVGQLEPNPWGLYDMHGNVWEWCLDQWQYAYPGGRAEDFRATERGWLRVARGGSWLYSASNCRSANRDDYGPNNRCSDIGFRVVLAPPIE